MASGRDKYQVVIGLEVHAQLLTESKIFAGDATTFGASPNSNVSVISLAHPGTLPKLNRKAIEYAAKMGIACHSEIARYQIFDRKNYFYPDLPKGYQITQDKTPICKGGRITVSIKEGEKDIPLNRIHLEEDAGKSIHVAGERETLIDLNRAGVPLIEIVTEPALHSSEEAGALLSEIRQMVRYLAICDGNMEEGSLRCDANVSLRLKGETRLGKKVEIKNMNSIRNVQRAIECEIDRQVELLERGEQITSETRLYDPNKNVTAAMRAKEELNDYRYFPDPDLSPVVITEEWLNNIKSSMPALPRELKVKLVTEYQLPAYDAGVLTESKEMAHYFMEVCRHTKNFKAASNWMMGPVKSFLNETGTEADKIPVSPDTLSQLINMVDAKKVSYATATQKIFPLLVKTPTVSPMDLAQELNLLQDSDVSQIELIVNEIIKEFPLKVEEYNKGKKAVVTMFMGEVMKRSKGKADPQLANELIIKKLNQSK